MRVVIGELTERLLALQFLGEFQPAGLEPVALQMESLQLRDELLETDRVGRDRGHRRLDLAVALGGPFEATLDPDELLLGAAPLRGAGDYSMNLPRFT